MDANNKYYQMMRTEIDSIQAPDIRLFGIKLLNTIPDYFFSVSASSSGKYHPACDLGEGGLVRHSINVKRMLDHLLVPEGYYDFTDREKNLLRLAALFHDCMKSGTQSDYESNPHTKFLHPVYASAFIMVQSSMCDFPYDDAVFVADAVASHMGQWCKSPKLEGTLPTPSRPAQRILHLADYLASRKDINISLDTDMSNESAPVEAVDKNNCSVNQK